MLDEAYLRLEHGQDRPAGDCPGRERELRCRCLGRMPKTPGVGSHRGSRDRMHAIFLAALWRLSQQASRLGTVTLRVVAVADEVEPAPRRAPPTFALVETEARRAVGYRVLPDGAVRPHPS